MKKHPLRYGVFCMLAICLFFLATGISSCKFIKGLFTHVKYDTVTRWVDWNILFDSKVSQRGRTESLAAIKRFIRDSSLLGVPHPEKFLVDTNSIQLDSCSCDSSLYNYTASLLIEGSGGSGQTPPVKSPGPSGGMGIFNLSKNNKMTADNKNTGIPHHIVAKIEADTVNEDVLLAIIDSGIDPTLFDKPGMKKILWPGSGSLPNQRNFTLEGPLDDMSDKTKVRHGSAVAALALEQFTKLKTYPRLMILKVFDSTESTRSFSVSCAMKYAIDHHASVINASWGYYASVGDPILHHYIMLAQKRYDAPIPLIAAAGNDTTANHDPLRYCQNPAKPERVLIDTNLFFPACYSIEDRNVISVTGLNNFGTPCYYQNYSSQYTTIGVQNISANDRECCVYQPAYLRGTNYIMDGTSFATPVISGKITLLMMQQGMKKDVNKYLPGLPLYQRGNAISTGTIDGQYIQY